jgi:hypothetical protein
MSLLSASLACTASFGGSIAPNFDRFVSVFYVSFTGLTGFLNSFVSVSFSAAGSLNSLTDLNAGFWNAFLSVSCATWLFVRGDTISTVSFGSEAEGVPDDPDVPDDSSLSLSFETPLPRVTSPGLATLPKLTS